MKTRSINSIPGTLFNLLKLFFLAQKLLLTSHKVAEELGKKWYKMALEIVCFWDVCICCSVYLSFNCLQWNPSSKLQYFYLRPRYIGLRFLLYAFTFTLNTQQNPKEMMIVCTDNNNNTNMKKGSVQLAQTIIYLWLGNH